MPPVVAAAGISAGAGLLGGLIQSGANRNAQRSQDRASQQAFQLEQQKMAEERRRYDAQQAAYAQWYRQQMDIRRQIAGRYGITLPDYNAPAAQGKLGGAPKAGTMPTVSTPEGQSSAAPGLTLGSIMGGQSGNMFDSQGGPVVSAAPVATPQGKTLGDMMGPTWNDWRNTSYG